MSGICSVSEQVCAENSMNKEQEQKEVKAVLDRSRLLSVVSEVSRFVGNDHIRRPAHVARLPLLHDREILSRCVRVN